MPNQWFRLYYEFATDPKVQSMPEKMQRRLVMLFCCQRDGPVTFCDDDMAFHWHVTTEDLDETKALFLKKGFIDDKWNLVNWNKRQYISDSSTERTRQYRERMRTSREQVRDVTVTAPDTDTEAKTEKRLAPPAVSLDVPAWIPKDSWEAFCEMRKKIRAPLTDKAKKLLIGKLRKECKTTNEVRAMLDQSTINSWRGVFEVREATNGQNGFSQNGRQNLQPTRNDSFRSAVGRAAQELWGEEGDEGADYGAPDSHQSLLPKPSA